MTATGSDRWSPAGDSADRELRGWDAWILPEHRDDDPAEPPAGPAWRPPATPAPPPAGGPPAYRALSRPIDYPKPPSAVPPPPPPVPLPVPDHGWEDATDVFPRYSDESVSYESPYDGLDGPTEVFARVAPPPSPEPVAPAAPPEPVPPSRPPARAATRKPATRKPGHPPRAVVRKRAARRRALEWPFLVVLSLLAAVVLRAFVVQTFFIPSQSMHDTLLEGDRVLVNKLSYRFHDVHRGDVIVFKRPPNVQLEDDDLIKRVVGLPGDQITGHEGKVYVNGVLLDEPYVQKDCTDGTTNLGDLIVPAGDLFVMGDNRCDSTDSRVFGPIDQSLVVGRAFVIIWPFGRAGWL